MLHVFNRATTRFKCLAQNKRAGTEKISILSLNVPVTCVLPLPLRRAKFSIIYPDLRHRLQSRNSPLTNSGRPLRSHLGCPSPRQPKLNLDRPKQPRRQEKENSIPGGKLWRYRHLRAIGGYRGLCLGSKSVTGRMEFTGVEG
jgi:hypothetical protein